MKTYDLYDAYLTYADIDRLTDSDGNKLFAWNFSKKQKSWTRIKHSIAVISEFLQIIDHAESNPELLVQLKVNPSSAKITYSMLGLMDRLISESPIAAINTFMQTILNINISQVANFDSPIATDMSNTAFIDVSYLQNESLQWIFLYTQTADIITVHAVRLRLLTSNKYLVMQYTSTILSTKFTSYKVTTAACLNSINVGILFVEGSLSTARFLVFDTVTGVFTMNRISGGSLLYERFLLSGKLPNIQLRPITATDNFELYIQIVSDEKIFSIHCMQMLYSDNSYFIKYERSPENTYQYQLTDAMIAKASNNQERLMFGILGCDTTKGITRGVDISESSLTLLSMSNFNHIPTLPNLPELSDVRANPTAYFNGEYDDLKLTMCIGVNDTKIENLFKDFDSATTAPFVNEQSFISRFWLNPTYGKMKSFYPDDLRINVNTALPIHANRLHTVAQSSVGIGVLLRTGGSTGLEGMTRYAFIAACLLSDSVAAIPSDSLSSSTGYVIDQTFARLCYYVDKENRSISGIQILRSVQTGVTVIGLTNNGWVELEQIYSMYPSTIKGSSLNRNGLMDNTSSYKGNPLMNNMFKQPAYVPSITKRPEEIDDEQHYYLSIRRGFGLSAVTESSTYHADEMVMLTAIAMKGFDFDGWYSNDTLLSKHESLQFRMPPNSLTIQAKAIVKDEAAPDKPDAPVAPEQEIIVTLDKMVGIENVIGAGTYAIGETVIIRASVKAGYHFLGWYLGSKILSSSAQFSFTVPNADVTLYAMAAMS